MEREWPNIAKNQVDLLLPEGGVNLVVSWSSFRSEDVAKTQRPSQGIHKTEGRS
jgi:hypothetical protein